MQVESNQKAISRFVEQFQDYFPGGDTHCPFGHDYGGPSYLYICFLGGGKGPNGEGLGPWDDPQYNFFIPLKYVTETLGWATINRYDHYQSATVLPDQDHPQGWSEPHVPHEHRVHGRRPCHQGLLGWGEAVSLGIK